MSYSSEPTTTAQEAAAYVDLGFFVSVAGGICREKNGKILRDAVCQSPVLPLSLELFLGTLGGNGTFRNGA